MEKEKNLTFEQRIEKDNKEFKKNLSEIGKLILELNKVKI